MEKLEAEVRSGGKKREAVRPRKKKKWQQRNSKGKQKVN
jgi:hypothetical protein